MTALELLLSQPLVLRLGWTLVHFIWQAALIAVILAIVLRCIRQQAATLRYAVASVSLILVVVAGVITFQRVTVLAPLPSGTPETTSIVAHTEISANTVVSPRIQNAPARPKPALSWPAFKHRCISLAEPAIPFIVMGWCVGVLSLSCLNLGGWTRLRRIRRQLSHPISEDLQQRAQAIALRLGVHKAFAVFESALVQVPAAFGHVKPVILLPAQALTGLSCEQIDIILAHELAHIKRCDYLINLFQTCIETLGFYHPAIWWLSHTIRRERENCCDDMVVRAFNNPVDYAKTLASMAFIRSNQIDLAMASNGSSLVQRIERLAPAGRQHKHRPTWLATGLSLILILSIAIPSTLAFAAKKDRRNRPASDDVTATFNEWINAIVDNDTKAFEIIAHKTALHEQQAAGQAGYATRLHNLAQTLRTYKGLHGLKIVSREDKGDHFDVLTSRIKDSQGVAGRLSISINTRARPYYVNHALRFITATGLSYSIPQTVLTETIFLSAPGDFPPIERLTDASGLISPKAWAGLREAARTMPDARILSMPSIMTMDGFSATARVGAEDGSNSLEATVRNLVQSDRSSIVLEYECRVAEGGRRTKANNTVTLPSGYATCTRLEPRPGKDQTLYFIVRSTIQESPSSKIKPVPMSPVPLPMEAFDEWLRAMKDDDSEAMNSIAEKQNALWGLDKAQVLAKLKKDAKALKRYTDLEQFRIYRLPKQTEDGWRVQTPVIKDGTGPEGYWTIVFQGLENPVVTDGIHFVTLSGETYPLHPQVLTTGYLISSPSELDLLNHHKNAQGGFEMLHKIQLAALLEKIRYTEGARIISKPMILQNSGDASSMHTDSFKLKLTNTVLTDRTTLMMDAQFKYTAEGSSVQISSQAMIRSGRAIVLGGHADSAGQYIYTILQPVTVTPGPKTTSVIEVTPPEMPQAVEPNAILTTAYICRVPKAWPKLKDIMAEDKQPCIMINDDALKAFLDGVEKTDSAELITSIETPCKFNETETITCDAIEDTMIELNITHHPSDDNDVIRSDIAMAYTRTEPNNQRSVSSIDTVVTYRLNHAIVQGSRSEGDVNDILVILHSKRVPRLNPEPYPPNPS